MLELKTLLWIEDQYHSELALRECFGDRYLCCNNELFARIRTLFLSLGFRYDKEASRLWRDYNSTPFFMLQNLIDQGVVPYNDNVNSLKGVVDRNPAFVISARSILTMVKGNYLLHESAHCISHRVLPEASSVGSSDAERTLFVLNAVACEAFANVVERLAHAFADSPTHVLFMNLNSYVQFTALQRQLLRDSIALFGVQNIFRLGFLTFVYLNTHSDELSDSLLQIFIEASFAKGPLSSIDKQILAILVRATFTLSDAFRNDTSALFFSLFRCEDQFRRCATIAFTERDLVALDIYAWLDSLTSSLFTQSDFLPRGAADCRPFAATGGA